MFSLLEYGKLDLWEETRGCFFFNFLAIICDFKHFHLLRFVFSTSSLLSFPSATSPLTGFAFANTIDRGKAPVVLLLVHTAIGRPSYRISGRLWLVLGVHQVEAFQGCTLLMFSDVPPSACYGSPLGGAARGG